MVKKESARADDGGNGSTETEEIGDDARRDTDTQDVLDGLPDGSEGWGYIEQASERSDDGGTKDGDDVRDAETESDTGEGAVTDPGAETDEGTDTEETPNTELLEKAASSDVSKHEVSEALDRADLPLGKGTVTAFVRECNSRVTGGSFAPGEGWKSSIGDEHEEFVEIGWIEDDGSLTAQGASVLCYARDVMENADGTDAALVGHLNTNGVEVFFKEALWRGPDEPGDDGGFLSRLLDD